MLTLDRIRVALAGVAVGLMIAVFYLRGLRTDGDLLDELRDGALLFVVISLGLSLWQSRKAKRQSAA
ncbi:hypothetical protein GCM10022280_02260 [Sphingomonas swuensis]|uniref:Uncharacterized protein n=1 Tax=Sphingomonas swuensis TaxID=977800 RepID=A0ABP7SAQ2_9SPHN